jgi:nucleotide-binding universal stress UspA family protein
MAFAVGRILVPTDFSATADLALDYARKLAVRFSASLQLLHVVEEPFLGGGIAAEIYVSDPSAVRAAAVGEALERLAARVTPHDRDELDASTHVVFGTVAESIIDHAVHARIDLIVMGTTARTGVAHLLAGDVAEHVVRLAPCPVLTVRRDATARDVMPAAQEATAS